MHCYGEMRYGKRSVREGTNFAYAAQIEYLVVAFEDEERTVKLSLRQADILEALATDPELLKQGGGVPDLARGPVQYALNPRTFSLITNGKTVRPSRHPRFTPSSDDLC